MPELPEVESIRLSLIKHVIGQTIVDVEVNLPRIIRCGELKTISGKTVDAIHRQGKYLWFTFKDNRLKLYFHMGMSGTLLWKKPDDENPTHVRVLIGFNKGRLLYRDPRTFGGLWIISNGHLPWSRLGVDMFDSELTPEMMYSLLSNHHTSIKDTLLDQGIVAGIGNIYASEGLFEACIDPRRKACNLSLVEITALHTRLVEIMRSAIANQGTTFRDFMLSDGRDGNYQQFLKVYNKEGKACTKCGKSIVKIKQAQRSTYFCPNCQI